MSLRSCYKAQRFFLNIPFLQKKIDKVYVLYFFCVPLQPKHNLKQK